MQGGAEKTAYFLHVCFLIHISFTLYIPILKTWRKKKELEVNNGVTFKDKTRPSVSHLNSQFVLQCINAKPYSGKKPKWAHLLLFLINEIPRTSLLSLHQSILITRLIYSIVYSKLYYVLISQEKEWLTLISRRSLRLKKSTQHHISVCIQLDCLAFSCLFHKRGDFLSKSFSVNA